METVLSALNGEIEYEEKEKFAKLLWKYFLIIILIKINILF